MLDHLAPDGARGEIANGSSRLHRVQEGGCARCDFIVGEKRSRRQLNELCFAHETTLTSKVSRRKPAQGLRRQLRLRHYADVIRVHPR